MRAIQTAEVFSRVFSPIPAGSAVLQKQLWSPRARDWAEIQEPVVSALYQSVLTALQLSPGTRLLDAGCGAGLFCVLASSSAQKICGVDATPAMLQIARERLPSADFFESDLEQLPFADNCFDVVTGLNSFQFTARPLAALKEAHRVLRRGGRLVLAAWGQPKDCEAAVCLDALNALLPPNDGIIGPFALSADGAMVSLASLAGFQLLAELQTMTVWDYPDEETALRGLLSTGLAARVITQVGEPAARNALQSSLASFKQADGNFRLRNIFRYVLVRK